MPPKKPKPIAPDHRASIEEHRKHAEEVLAYEDYKKKPDGFKDRTDEAKP